MAEAALQYADPRADLDAWAARLGISREAVELYAASDVIDLHIESYIWTRLFGYDLGKRHGRGALGARFYSQVDLPRVLESGMTGGVWSIATNPYRRRSRRTTTLLHNVTELRRSLSRYPQQIEVVSDHAGYLRARARGRYACWLAIQGGNALDSSADDLAAIPDGCVTRITLIHMSNSTLGASSFYLSRRDRGLTDFGRDYLRQMNAERILVDLSHISQAGFRDALEVHDRSQPAIISHTGVRAVRDIWRNVDDSQIKAIAETGGVIGIIFHVGFLGGRTADAIVDHLEHVVRVAGEDFTALGSDWDGMITTPRDMQTVLELPVLVQRMLDRGWSSARVQKTLGGNYLRVMRQIRPGRPHSTVE